MSQRCVPLFKCAVWTLVLTGVCVQMASAASGSCASLGALPSVLEVAQGTQQALDSPVSITRIAVGDPTIADVQANGDSAFVLTGVAPAPPA